MSQMIQQLESRQLLSAVLDSGVLTVTGTSGNDNIQVSLSKDGTTITVSESIAKRFRKTTATTTTFTAADVTSIVVNAGAGNDNVSFHPRRGTAFVIPATINGEDGNDNLSGAGGADLINGGAGDDNLDGAAGNDTLNGDAGEDKVVGGAGVDNLNGGDDDDLLIAADGDGEADILDGGADSAVTGEDDADRAVVDDADTVTNATSEAPPTRGRHGRGHGQCPPSSSTTTAAVKASASAKTFGLRRVR